MEINDFGKWNLLTSDQLDLIQSVNKTTATFARDKTLAQLFSEQAAKSPAQLAICFEDEQITYQQLDQRSNQVAHFLHRQGAQSGHIVALLMERCIDAYVALLGILKAGAAYLPLDPNNQKERLQQILQQNNIYALLTKSTFLHVGTAQEHLFVLLFDELKAFQRAKKRSHKVFDYHDLREFSVANLSLQSEPTDLAYVIFTSGSNGIPKGVMIEQRSVVNFTQWVKDTFTILPESHVLQNASLFFDASVQQIFPALTSGATLFPVPEYIRVDPPQFVNWIRANAISHWDSVPSLWYPIVDECINQAQLDSLDLPHLKAIILGGEALRADKVNQWRQIVKTPHQLVNVYGPTEATVNATYYPITGLEGNPIIPIGRPLPNTEIYILNKELQPCMPNVEGEIYIGGVALARGYVNAEKETARAFIQTTLLNGVEQRLYRTGDYGRLLPSGVFEFIGRRDEQIKLRGYRIELGEIESVMRLCPGVKEVAVLVTQEEVETKRKLIAFYTAGDASIDELLQTMLQERLPLFMMPSQIIRLESLLYTANWKVDKRALLMQYKAQEGNAIEFAAPTTKTERTLTTVINDLLNIKIANINENFFALGCDSISIIRLRHHCKRHNIQLNAIDFFKYPSVRELAAYIDTVQGLQSDIKTSQTVTGQDNLGHLIYGQMQSLPLNVEVVLPLLPMQAAMLQDALLSNQSQSYIIQEHLRFHGSFSLPVFTKALNIVIARHQSLRTVFRVDITDQPVQLVFSELVYQPSFNDLTSLSPNDQQQEIINKAKDDRQLGFNLAQRPPFMVNVYQTDSDLVDIVFTIHHIISDGWSWSIILYELQQCYSSIISNSEVLLLPLQSSFKDYVLYCQRIETQEARLFWKNYLSEITTLNLPKDPIHSSTIDEAVHIATFSLSLEDTERLIQFARRSATTLNAVCLSCYALLLQYICRQENLIFGIITSNRAQPVDGIENIVGCLINLIPIKISLDGITNFNDVLSEVKQNLAVITGHEYLSLADITQQSSLPASASFLESIFGFQNYPTTTEQMKPLNKNMEFRVDDIDSRESTPIPLSVIFDPQSGALVVRFEYLPKLFREQTIRAWCDILLAILVQSISEV